METEPTIKESLTHQTHGGAGLPLSRLVRRFRSGASGLWYENPHAAGTINAVELDGQILERNEGEQTMPWIRRVGEWASAIHSANAQSEATPPEPR